VREWAVVFPTDKAVAFEKGEQSALSELVRLANTTGYVEALQAGLTRVAASLSYASMECRVPVADAFTLQLERLVERSHRCSRPAP
jgi:hypothetical protein